ncbi:hypothetical protein Esti_003167 [Eimeria stiedai]
MNPFLQAFFLCSLLTGSVSLTGCLRVSPSRFESKLHQKQQQSGNPESNEEPTDTCSIYSLPLYQLSYRRPAETEGSNALLLLPRKAKQHKTASAKQQQQQQQQRKPSNRKQRKLQQLLKKHADKEIKAELWEQLQLHQLVAPSTSKDADAGAAEGAEEDKVKSSTRPAAAGGAVTEDVRLAKAQLLLGGGFLPVLTGVKGRRLQKKAKKLVLLQQQLQQSKNEIGQKEKRMQRPQQQQQEELQQEGKKGQKQQIQEQQQQQHAAPQQQKMKHTSSCIDENAKNGEVSLFQQHQAQQQQHREAHPKKQQQQRGEQQEEQQQQQQQQDAAEPSKKESDFPEAGQNSDVAAQAHQSNSSSTRSSSTDVLGAARKSSSAKPCQQASSSAAKGGVTSTPGKAGRGNFSRLVYSRETAASLLQRPAHLEPARAALPAAEAEPQILSFLMQQEHPSAGVEDEKGSSSSSEEQGPGRSAAAVGETAKRRCKRKRQQQRDLTKCKHTDVLCVSGPTGSGKSTQVVQFAFESGICFPEMTFPSTCAAARLLLPGAAADSAAAVGAGGCSKGYGFVSAEEARKKISVKRKLQICITQPRRVAAVSLSRRVAEEMGNPELVGYQASCMHACIRHDRHNVGPQCSLKFVTDGVLLREIQEDFLCSKYCCIIVDEAHERSINVDLLLGLLSRVVHLRRLRFQNNEDTLPPLKMLIMSATLKAADFTENSRLFAPSPALVSLKSRSFEVSVHFSKKTATHYVEAAVKKALQIHTRLPAGSILVFLTGRAEVLEAVRQLQAWQQRRDRRSHSAVAVAAAAAAVGGDTSEDAEVEASFELSDHSEDEPLPVAKDHGEGASDSDAEEFAHDSKRGAASAQQQQQPQLQLASLSDREEGDECDDAVIKAEADVLKSLMSRPAPPPSRKVATVARAAAAASGEKGPELSLSAHPSKRTISFKLIGKTRRQRAEVKADQPLQRTEAAAESTAAVSPISGDGGKGVYAFDAVDTSKRRVRKAVPEGGWLGAGAHFVRRAAGGGDAARAVTGLGKEGGVQQHMDRDADEQEGLVIDTPRLTAIPLYATLPAELQKLAFEPPKDDERKIIVATNVAETSVTLPNIRYVVDSGREKKRVFASGSDCFSYFTVGLTSQAAAEQRAGRAGRVGAGVCYRLYSSAVFDYQMEKHAAPQIHSMPLDHLLLFMSALGVPRPSAFPFPSPPPAAALAAARSRLVALGAVDPKKTDKAGGWHKKIKGFREPEVTCTKLGRQMSQLPIPPRFAKMLLLACARHKEHGVSFVALACYLVAALSVGEVLPHQTRLDAEESLVASERSSDSAAADKGGRNNKKPWDGQENDVDAYLWLCGAYSNASNPNTFCRSFGIDPSRMAEVAALAAQLAQLLHPLLQRARQRQPQQQEENDALQGDRNEAFEAELKSLQPPLRLELPTAPAQRCLHECVVQGLIDHVAVWEDAASRLPPDATPAQKAAGRGGYRCAELKGQLALLHSSSSLMRVSPRPKAIVYNQLLHEGRALLHGCLPIDLATISKCDSPLIQHTFLQLPPPAYDERLDAVVGWSRPTYSPLQLPLPAVERPLPRMVQQSASAEASTAPLSQQQQQQRQQLFGCFAAAFLAGRVVPHIKRLSASLSVTPEGMLAGSRSSSFAVRAFVAELAKADVASRADLVRMWQKEPAFLSAEFIGLLRSYNYETLQDIRDKWPPL